MSSEGSEPDLTPGGFAPPDWLKNPGYAPEDLKRVRVVLRSTGAEPVYDDNWNPMSPPGWAVATTRWSLTGDPCDVIWYRPL